MRIESVTKQFNDLKALDGVSCQFDCGKIIVFAGPNGAGKTTLLRIIAGLIRPTSGRVMFTPHPSPLFRQTTGGQAQGERGLSIMMQESYLYRDMTPRENLFLYASLYGLSDERVEEVENLLGLTPFFDHEVDTLSHGQKQRVSLARAILPDSDILLLDEPFLGLDSSSIADLQKYLMAVQKRGGLVLVATHELDLVRQIADGLLFLENGKIKYFGEFNI